MYNVFLCNTVTYSGTPILLLQLFFSCLNNVFSSVILKIVRVLTPEQPPSVLPQLFTTIRTHYPKLPQHVCLPIIRTANGAWTPLSSRWTSCRRAGYVREHTRILKVAAAAAAELWARGVREAWFIKTKVD